MKILSRLFGTGLLAFILMLAVPQHTRAQDEGEISFQTFYDDLSPYGTWIEDPQYGDVWVPDAGPDFRPYATNGHWAMTDYGNTWVSDYEWGWAPFHYGRWRFDDYYGWEWVPDYEWGPAWVDWRSSSDYYGWAPLGPGISLDVAIGGGYNVPDNYWVFAPCAYINSPVIYNYYVPRTRVVSIIHRTTFIRNTYTNRNRRYITGPRPNEIERFTHKPVNVYHINNASRPGKVGIQNNQVNIYRPRVQKAPDARPGRVVDAAAYRAANPNQGIARHGTAGGSRINHENAQRLANFARTATPDNKIVHENNRGNRPAGGNNHGNNNRPAIVGSNRPTRTDAPSRTSGNPSPANRPGQPGQNREQQMQQQRDQQRSQQRQQQMMQQRNQQQMQQRQQQMQQQREQRNQQQEQQRQQQMMQRQQQMQQQRNQQQEQQRQQQVQQQQMQQQRQQQQHNERPPR